jgi:hypothetical protein
MRDRPLSLALGLRDMSGPDALEEVCETCHLESTRLAPFDAAAAWRRIGH